MARKPAPVADYHLQSRPSGWGKRQVRNTITERTPWNNYLWAFENPHPDKAIVALRFEPVSGTVVISGLAAGNANSMPLRWSRRQKAVLTLPPETEFDPQLNDVGNLGQIILDLGQVISVSPRLSYPINDWGQTRRSRPPAHADHELVVEYAAHPDATFHFDNGTRVKVSDVGDNAMNQSWALARIEPAVQRVALRMLDKKSGRPVAAKLHVHGEAGEYFAPVDRDRSPNANWFEDYNPDHVEDDHISTYVPGEMDLSRFRSAPRAHLSGDSFESQGTFPAQC